MVRNLGDWRGYRVKFLGVIEKIENDRILLVDVFVNLYSNTNSQHRVIDHVWCYPPKGKVDQSQYNTGDELLGIADVIQYQRSNKTFDYAFQHIEGVDFSRITSFFKPIHNEELLAAEMKEAWKNPLNEQVELIKFCLNHLQKRTLILGVNDNPQDCKKQLEEILGELQTSLRLEEKATANQLRGQLNADPVQFKSAKKSSKGKGFG